MLLLIDQLQKIILYMSFSAIIRDYVNVEFLICKTWGYMFFFLSFVFLLRFVFSLSLFKKKKYIFFSYLVCLLSNHEMPFSVWCINEYMGIIIMWDLRVMYVMWVQTNSRSKYRWNCSWMISTLLLTLFLLFWSISLSYYFFKHLLNYFRDLHWCTYLTCLNRASRGDFLSQKERENIF